MTVHRKSAIMWSIMPHPPSGDAVVQANGTLKMPC